MEDLKKSVNHKMTIDARARSMITGVVDVISFDAKEVILETDMGLLTIRGDELHVNRLTLEKGEVDLDGRLDSFTYADKKNSGEDSFIKRIFR